MGLQKQLILRHLKKDKILKQVITKIGELPAKRSNDLYLALLKSIVSQQLSVKAADTIWKRFLGLFKTNYPDAKQLLKLSDEQLRAAGLSYQKAGYLKNIARFSIEETLEYKLLKKKSDEELIDHLVQIKGVGRWTVEMVLMFSLNRPDIFPLDDLGIQNGIKSLYNLTTTNKKELYTQMVQLAENWRPHRTIACRYIWRYKDVLVGSPK